MVFSSYEFIFLFLPFVVCFYYLIGKLFSIRIQHGFLVIASLFFYAYFHVNYLWIILFSILINYSIAVFLQRTQSDSSKQALFILGLLFNVGLLGYFKYYDFFVNNLNHVVGSTFALKHLILPLGISFFTFQQFSFLLSVFRGEEKVENLIDYSLFVTFFPQLIAGPIVLYSEMIPQFKEDARRNLRYDHLAEGIYIFVIGLFKKIVLADTLAVFANNGFDVVSNLGFATAWATSLSYTLQIYFDFSGYSDMAIGIGKMFNINLPQNFDSPYKSASIKEFWRRWHMTLGRALSTYIYKPLGGNRKGLTRTCINTLIVFFVSGLWHGAAWTFIIWGMLHGVLSVLETLLAKPLAKVPVLLRQFGTFMFLNTTFVVFRGSNLASIQKVLTGMFLPASLDLNRMTAIVNDGLLAFPNIVNLAFIFVFLALLLGIVFFGQNASTHAQAFSFSKRNLAFTAAAFVLAVLHLSRSSVFIYFNF